MSNLHVAKALAMGVHHDQTDKGGHPYIEHPLRVAEKMDTEELKIIAVMHDCIEDGQLILDELKWLGFSDAVIIALDALTRRPEEKYFQYIERLSKNPLAVKVKIADLEDNINISRIPHPTEKDFKRCEKYQRALGQLRSIA